VHSHFSDSYSHLDSPVHRLPAWLKVLAALAIVIAVVTVPASPVFLGSVAIFLLTVALASNVPGPFLLKRLLFLEPFVLGVAVLTLLQPHGGIKFLIVASRSTLCILTLVLLSNTTPFSDLLDVLKRARVPSLMVTTIALMYRYLFVLKDESARMQAARSSRTFTPNRRHNWSTLATVLGKLFVRSGLRAERIYAAMCARGWK
jgi:cobalt/nickel transport system permease protein